MEKIRGGGICINKLLEWGGGLLNFFKKMCGGGGLQLNLKELYLELAPDSPIWIGASNLELSGSSSYSVPPAWIAPAVILICKFLFCITNTSSKQVIISCGPVVYTNVYNIVHFHVGTIYFASINLVSAWYIFLNSRTIL